MSLPTRESDDEALPLQRTLEADAGANCSPTTTNNEKALLEQSLQGNAQALGALRNNHHSSLRNILLSRGASNTEAEDLLADLWGECVPGQDERPSLLEKFSGKCSLGSWLATVATNRWIDFRRRSSRQADVVSAHDSAQTDFFQRIPSSERAPGESALLDLLRHALQTAFGRCPAEAIVMLRLVYLYGVAQREIVRMWGWHESKVSRALSRAMAQIQTDTLDEMKKSDPLLTLDWQDLLELCQTHQLGFL